MDRTRSLRPAPGRRPNGQMTRCFSGAALTYIEQTHQSRRRVGNLSNLARQYRRWKLLRALRGWIPLGVLVAFVAGHTLPALGL